MLGSPRWPKKIQALEIMLKHDLNVIDLHPH